MALANSFRSLVLAAQYFVARPIIRRNVLVILYELKLYR